jgi:hypothetical protein
MDDALGTVLIVVVIAAALIAVATLVTSGSTYDQIGRGGLSLRDGSDRPASEPANTNFVSDRERDEEIRQMLGARNERRARQGREPLDVEAELRSLTEAAIDPGIEAEIRSLVVARNERRARRGQEPLDVEAEVARQIRDLGAGPTRGDA